MRRTISAMRPQNNRPHLPSATHEAQLPELNQEQFQPEPDRGADHASEDAEENCSNWKFFCCCLHRGLELVRGAGPLSKSIPFRVSWTSTIRSE